MTADAKITINGTDTSCLHEATSGPITYPDTDTWLELRGIRIAIPANKRLELTPTEDHIDAQILDLERA